MPVDRAPPTCTVATAPSRRRRANTRGNAMRARGCFALLLVAMLSLVSPGSAGALDYPTRPIRVIVPFAASGVTDIVSRIVFDKVGQWIGQQGIFDNCPGAGGNIGVGEEVAGADGGCELL